MSVHAKMTALRAADRAQIPARVRWLSVEPLLEHIELDLSRIHWVVVGGESGPKWRERVMNLAWMESIIEQCRAARIAIFVKQDSAFQPGQQGRISDHMWALKQFPEVR